MKNLTAALIILSSTIAFSKSEQSSAVVCNTSHIGLNADLQGIEKQVYPLYRTSTNEPVYLTKDKFTISAPSAVGNQICVSVNVK